jgi:hypothetical protein
MVPGTTEDAGQSPQISLSEAIGMNERTSPEKVVPAMPCQKDASSQGSEPLEHQTVAGGPSRKWAVEIVTRSDFQVPQAVRQKRLDLDP